MRLAPLLLIAALLLHPAGAIADPAPAPPTSLLSAPAPTPPLFAPSVSALEADPEYRAGRGQRLAGILVSAIVGGLGLIAGVAMVSVLEPCGSGCSVFAAVGFGGAAVGLGIGIPLAVIGEGKMRRARIRMGFTAWRSGLALRWEL